ncbi:hypothetical protein [Saccharothrix violaceirubra]|uniref:CDP-glycerol:poly(Glycerophosphate) glycerophosphotransferase n=1 Tax=Saccharothrix violaceirubra TaxID=413306 RepID=A0A7W7T381_9PSEU|nr:hypothetical protein [Saccharothrix violaceirubra]MBB4965187.1 hypothetical protein [Saccharothrix violaceirubra]
MFDERWAEVPARPVATPWATRRAARSVLGVVHNVTSATRLFDVLPLLAADPRVQVVFSCTGSSPFTPGTVEHLTGLGALTVPWDQAVRTRFDLAVSASHGALESLDVPLVVLPHGIGYNKYLARGEGDRLPVFGLSPEWLVHDGRVIPTSLVLSHTEQLDRLAVGCPPAVARAVVAGDPCFDRMLVSRPLRATYRSALGVRRGQKLVVVSSTWGRDSLFDHAADVVRRLRFDLPVDEYRVVLALHPNTWFGHSSWQVRTWLDECTRAGVVVLPPEEGWRAALVAADVLVGDHGSVTYYGAALGIPVLLATRAVDAVDPASAVGRFLAVAPHLDPTRPVGPQIDRAATTPETRAAAGLVTSAPGGSAALLRAELYRLLDLPEPPGRAEVRTVPTPRVAEVPVVQHWVRVADDRVTRFPADPSRATPAGCHLVVGTDTPRADLLEAADVVVNAEPGDAHVWTAETFDALPGALVATMPLEPGRWLVAIRGDEPLVCTGPDRFGPVWASILLDHWTRELPPPSRITARLGAEHADAEVTAFARG